MNFALEMNSTQNDQMHNYSLYKLTHIISGQSGGSADLRVVENRTDFNLDNNTMSWLQSNLFGFIVFDFLQLLGSDADEDNDQDQAKHHTCNVLILYNAYNV